MALTAGTTHADPGKDGGVEQHEQVSEAVFELGTREKIAFATLLIMSFYAALESTGIGVALPSIAQDTHASSVQAFWVGTSYLLASAVCQPPFASFSHTFGRLPVTIVTLLLFIAGSIICAVAHNVPTILVGRTMQGAGSGGGLSLIEIIITDLVPLRFRGAYFGLNALAWALGSAISPLIGGALTEKASWRWIFWIMLPLWVLARWDIRLRARLMFASAVASLLILPISLRLRPTKGSFVDKVKEVDWIGCFLLMTSATSTLVAISWGGLMFAWSSYHTLVPLILGIAGLAAFAIWEKYFVKQPLIPMSIFNNRTAVTVYWQSLVSGLNMWAIVYYMPLYFQAVKGYSTIISGVAILPTLLAVAPSAAITGFAIKKIGSYRKILWFGWILATLGAGIMLRLDLDITIPQWIFTNCVGGLGVGILLPVMRLAVQASAADEDIAHAAAMVMTFRTLGMSLSLAILGVIFQNVFEQKLEASAYSGQLGGLTQNVLGVVEVIKLLPNDSADKLILRQVFSESLRMIWATLLAFNGFSLISSLFTKELSLDRLLITEQGVDRETDHVLEVDDDGSAAANGMKEEASGPTEKAASKSDSDAEIKLQ